MQITINKLCHDTYHFIHNHYNTILIFLIITTFIQTSLDFILLPKKEEIMFINNFVGANLQEIIQKLSIDQQYLLIKLSITNNISKLISNTFLFSNILNMLHLTTAHKSYYYSKIRHIITTSMPFFPKFLLLIFIMSLLVQFGLIFAIIPGILLAIIISLTPIIIIFDNVSIKKAIYTSIKLSCHNVYLITPVILLWFLTKIILILIIAHNYNIYKTITKIILNNCNNILSIIILIYLYRFYMLIKQRNTTINHY